MSDGMYMRQGKCSALNITAATQVSVVPKDNTLASARLVRVIVQVAGSSAGAAYDSASVSGAGAANQVAPIPNAVGPILIDMPIVNGITIIPGTGQVVSVSYD